MKRTGMVMAPITLGLAAMLPAAGLAKRSYESIPPPAAEAPGQVDPQLASKVSATAKPDDNGNGGGRSHAGGNGKAKGCGVGQGKGRGKATGCNASPG